MRSHVGQRVMRQRRTLLRAYLVLLTGHIAGSFSCILVLGWFLVVMGRSAPDQLLRATPILTVGGSAATLTFGATAALLGRRWPWSEVPDLLRSSLFAGVGTWLLAFFIGSFPVSVNPGLPREMVFSLIFGVSGAIAAFVVLPSERGPCRDPTEL